jgi:hypothetical protein
MEQRSKGESWFRKHPKVMFHRNSRQKTEYLQQKWRRRGFSKITLLPLGPIEQVMMTKFNYEDCDIQSNKPDGEGRQRKHFLSHLSSHEDREDSSRSVKHHQHYKMPARLYQECEQRISMAIYKYRVMFSQIIPRKRFSSLRNSTGSQLLILSQPQPWNLHTLQIRRKCVSTAFIIALKQIAPLRSLYLSVTQRETATPLA